jgi:hypothetical protein
MVFSNPPKYLGREVWEDSKWQLITDEQWGKIPKIEAQCWLAIYNLLMTPDSAKKYEITENRKSHLLKLRKYLNEVLLDQIPPLAGLLKQLEFLSMQQCNTLQQKNPYMVQQIPEIRNKILEGRDWLEIAQFQKENYWSADQHKDKREFDLLLELTEVYGNEAVDTIVDGFTCPNCNKTAIQRCSRCKSEWYCGKACQVIFFFDD